MNYQETIHWMFAQLPMYQQQGKSAFNAKLDNIIHFCEALNQPQEQFKSIHVAGTNGKGSTSHMLASVLQEAGYKVGLYTSPHLKDFRERIKIDGKMISEDAVTKFIAANLDFLKSHKLSFFEMTVGMAFDYFAKEQVDIAIVEVGLGGRLDSTNIITPEVAVITNIGFDHVDMLGDTLPKIAFEKAGIIKENIPVVISEFNEETFPVFTKIAKTKNASLFLAETLIKEDYASDLLGDYQHKNSKAVVCALKQLLSFKVSEEHIKAGILNVVKNTGLQGRWQQLSDRPKIICDTAHNKEGLAIVLNQLKKEKFENLHIVLGVVKDKNLDLILPLFPKNAKYYFCSPNISRGLPAVELQQKAIHFSLIGTVFYSVSEAYKKALEVAGKNDFIYVGGSTFVVAEII
ncbi:bifunctional folylpolyglutamate synthase/dihydrofolate synthase [Zhouia sp. PK063]|uniref:bifunctional folylpolyglutamate synthase/dihydrofolate synthase n=1 Tax=Zhouia sp. PK063 TaxID=3373602 RepID=UPI0037962A3B